MRMVPAAPGLTLYLFGRGSTKADPRPLIGHEAGLLLPSSHIKKWAALYGAAHEEIMR